MESPHRENKVVVKEKRADEKKRLSEGRERNERMKRGGRKGRISGRPSVCLHALTVAGVLNHGDDKSEDGIDGLVPMSVVKWFFLSASAVSE